MEGMCWLVGEKKPARVRLLKAVRTGGGLSGERHLRPVCVATQTRRAATH